MHILRSRLCQVFSMEELAHTLLFREGVVESWVLEVSHTIQTMPSNDYSKENAKFKNNLLTSFYLLYLYIFN